jgi:hypothetical protein
MRKLPSTSLALILLNLAPYNLYLYDRKHDIQLKQKRKKIKMKQRCLIWRDVLVPEINIYIGA